jgi:butyryl-CoA dehydrogenase
MAGSPRRPGSDYLSYIIVIHELAKIDASHAITVSAHTTLGTSPIMDFGTEQQKQRYVPMLAAGKVLAGFGLTEPAAGSDAGGTKTTATDKGDHYLLNGSKIFITHGGVGELFIATARTDPAAQGAHGITVFIVTKDTCDLAEAVRIGLGHDPTLAKCPGVLAGKKEDKLGWRASDTRELVFQDAIVPKENVLGTVNDGFRQMLQTLDGGRIGLGALALGIAEGAFAECLRYAGVRQQFGQPIAALPGRALRPRRHGHGDRRGDAPRLPRGPAQADRPALQDRSGDGQTVCFGAGDACHDEGRAAARGPRLHHRRSGGADDA